MSKKNGKLSNEVVQAYNNYVDSAEIYLRYKRQLEVSSQQKDNLDSIVFVLDAKKDNSPKDKARYTEIVPEVKATLRQLKVLIKTCIVGVTHGTPEVIRLHAVLTKALSPDIRDGQKMFVLPHCVRNGDYVFAPKVEQVSIVRLGRVVKHWDIQQKVSFTRHIKHGRGSALLYGDLLPVMRYKSL